MPSFLSDAPAMLTDLKVANRKAVIQVFRSGDVYDANEVSVITGLSRPTVMKCIHYFMETGLLISCGKGKSTSTGGKRPEQFSLADELYYVCLSLWPQETRVHLYSIRHSLIASKTISSPLSETAAEASRLAASAVQTLLEENSIQPSSIVAASVSVPGTVDHETGTLLFSSHKPDWGTHIHLLDDLHALLGAETPLFIENAGKMCARPYLTDPDVRTKRVLVLFTTWGLSGCMIERGHILNGRNALIGEIGHMIIDPNDPEACGCGSHGCFERLVSRSRVNQMLREAAPHAFPETPLLTIPEVFAKSAEGDPAVQEMLRRLAGTFARALRNITLVFDPDLVIFQGDYGFADSFFESELRRQMGDFRYLPTSHPFEIQFDRRPLETMDAEGSFFALDHLFFDHLDHYQAEQQPNRE
ncbi:MAG: ROK family protein [Clostridia bacterium]|nr:ROK family protein [Clostridia bacterium]